MVCVIANSYFTKFNKNPMSSIGSIDRLDYIISKSITFLITSQVWLKLLPITSYMLLLLLFR